MLNVLYHLHWNDTFDGLEKGIYNYFYSNVEKIGKCLKAMKPPPSSIFSFVPFCRLKNCVGYMFVVGEQVIN